MKIKKQFLTCWDSPRERGKEPKREEKENFIRKRVLISKGERNIGENIITSQVLKNVVF